MNTTLRYIAMVLAFAATAAAFAHGATWAGLLAAAAGIVTVLTIVRKEPK